jgi:hypothetical protein
MRRMAVRQTQESGGGRTAMMKRMRVFGLGLAVGLAVGLAAAAEGRAEAPKLGLHADLTCATKYMAHGFNVNGDNPSLQPSIAVDALVPGLQFALWMGLPTERDQRDMDEHDWMIKYGRLFFADRPWAMQVRGYADYWIYPHTPGQGEIDEATGKAKDDFRGFKFHGAVAFPRLLPLGPASLVPAYGYYCWMPEIEDAFESGGVHELFLSYALPLKSFLPVEGSQSLDFGASHNYHDGAFGVEPGWSHSTAHLSTTFAVAGFRITPAVNCQWSYEDTVDDEDEFWACLSVARDF